MAIALKKLLSGEPMVEQFNINRMVWKGDPRAYDLTRNPGASETGFQAVHAQRPWTRKTINLVF